MEENGQQHLSHNSLILRIVAYKNSPIQHLGLEKFKASFGEALKWTTLSLVEVHQQKSVIAVSQLPQVLSFSQGREHDYFKTCKEVANAQWKLAELGILNAPV